jgi:protein gp37
MGERTAIQWTEHTWNPWQGCAKVSDGCENCYMFRDKKRYGQDPEAVVRSKPPTFNKPLTWREPARVFTCSWSDWFIREADPWRPEAWDVIRRTPHLTYQILTKRPARIPRCLPPDWGNGYPNVWLGVSVEDQATADARIPQLLDTPARVRFLSCEPLLGPVDLSRWLFATCHPGCGWINGSPVREVPDGCHQCGQGGPYERLDWVIVGGESGPGARITDAADIRRLVEQCRAGKVPVFVKQLGRVAIDTDWHGLAPLSLRDPKGGDLSEFPEDLRVREFPGGAK